MKLQTEYEKWAKSAGFVSMLPKDSAARKEAEATTKLQQSRVDQHFEPMKPGDKPIPYSESAFREAALQWLVETDQVCDNNIYTYFLLLIRANLNVSPFKPLSIRHSKRWSRSLRRQPVRSIFLTGSKREPKLFHSLWHRCKAWKRGSMYVIFVHLFISTS